MAQAGQTVIFSTHIMQHAERLCDRMLLITKGKKVFDGTLAHAHAIIPRRVVIECADDIRSVLNSTHTLGVHEVIAEDGQKHPTIRRWEILINEQTDPQSILQSCINAGVALTRFDHSQPSLHDVFVHLVGSDAKEHHLR
jgi:ABC-2 type transport system ATP-binding protein